MVSPTWTVMVREAVERKQDLVRIAPRDYVLRLPGAPASESAIGKAESAIGLRLDPDYRGFLLAADGWHGFLASLGIFGCADLLGSPLRQRGEETLAVWRNGGYLEAHGLAPGTFLMIAASEHSRPFALVRLHGSSSPGEVVFFTGDDVEVFSTFREFFTKRVYAEEEAVRALTRSNKWPR
jgi:hypothetical protein